MSGDAGEVRAAELERLLAAIRSCRKCVDDPQGQPLAHAPRPVLRASTTARLAICSQAPGTLVHASGTPFTDRSGDRLRDWLAVTPQEFYDENRVAIVPMGFCFPGQDAKGADLPPRRECAPLWHEKLFAMLPQIELLLAVGSYAQSWHLGQDMGATLTDTMGTGALISGASDDRAFCLCRIRLGATTLGSRTIPGSSKSFCRCCAARCGSSSKISACGEG